MSKIQVVWFQDLTRWDTKNYLNQLKAKFPLVRLRELIDENTNKIKPFDFPHQKFDILGVTNKEGVYFNETLLGSQIKQPYYQVSCGDIFYNPYRVNVGSIGIVPKEFDKKFTSPAYVVFRTDETRLLAHFLIFILKSSWFNSYLRANTKGSVRQNLSFESLGDLQIPLPPLDIQNKIVEDIQNIQAKIKALKEEEQRLKDEIEAYIYIALGLSKQEIGQKHKVFIVNFKDLERWDIRHNQNSPHLVPCDSALCHCEPPHSASAPCDSAFSPCHSERSEESTQKNNRFFANAQNDNATKKPKYPLVALGEICEIITGCTPQTNNKDFYGKEYPFYRPTDLNSGQISKSKIMLSSLGYQLHRPLPINSILVTCIGATIGKTAIIKRSGICNQQINAILPNEKFLPKYMYFLCNTQYFKDLLLQNSSITTIPIINKNIFSKIKIPLPPLKIQQEIVAFIESKNQKIKSCKENQITLQEQLNSMLKESLL